MKKTIRILLCTFIALIIMPCLMIAELLGWNDVFIIDEYGE